MKNVLSQIDSRLDCLTSSNKSINYLEQIRILRIKF